MRQTRKLTDSDDRQHGTNPRRILKWLWVLLALAALSWLVWLAMPMTGSQRQRNRVAVDYQSCFALVSGNDTLLYIGEMSDDWTRTSVSVEYGNLTPRHETLNGVWHNKYMLVPSCHGRILTFNPDHNADSILKVVNDTLPRLVRRQETLLAEKSKTLGRTVRELMYFMRVHSVIDNGYHVVAAHYTEVAAGKELIDSALSALRSARNRPLRMCVVQRFTAVCKDGEVETQRYVCDMQRDAPPQLLCTIQTRSRRKPAHAFATFSGKPGQYRAAPQPEFTYMGETDNGKRNGHGIYSDRAGNYYDGFWADGMREGFGCSVDSAGNVRVGLWKADRFRGERLNYNTERIYGIDVARYQHESGGRSHPIAWDRLRISSLGVKTPKTITGKVDYPVSFVFIKSTEGTTVTNRYYISDYAAARKNGIRVGAYHFFSTKSNPKEQARHFLRHTRFTRGDLPPVLDVEPSDAQIAAMGGAETMFANIRTWMGIVENATGVRPILYINQMFVNRYMPLAPDIAAAYEVWIARYNEFKPDMHLVFWQLGYDGRVTGIRGDVDINVFNGYRDEWEGYLERRTFGGGRR